MIRGLQDGRRTRGRTLDTGPWTLDGSLWLWRAWPSTASSAPPSRTIGVVSVRGRVWSTRHMRLARTTMGMLALSMPRLAVAVRVRARRVLRLPVLHGGRVAAEHFEPGERVRKTWPLRQPSRDPWGQRGVR